MRKKDEHGCFICMDKPIKYTGVNDIDTDELIFVTFTIFGNKLTMTYLDTGPGVGRKNPGTAHNNTNDELESHVIKEVIIPDNYYFDENSFKGKSYGEGCDTVEFEGTKLSVVYCGDGYIQTPTVEWEFTLYPNGWTD